VGMESKSWSLDLRSLKDENSTFYNLPGYNFAYKNMKNKIGGGVGIYIHSSLAFNIVSNDIIIPDLAFEFMIAEVFLPVNNIIKNLTIINIYRSPDTEISLFDSQLSMIINMFIKNAKNVIL